MGALFWELHSGHDREGPGSREDTLRALELTGLSGPVDVLDIGCGPGAASLVLLEALPEARVTAVDLHEPFVAQARARAEAEGFADQFRAIPADMGDLPFGAGEFDLIWCEGAAYFLGVGAALRKWRHLLKQGGRIAFSEAVWLTDDPAPRAAAMWEEYAAMTDMAGVRAVIAAEGWSLLGDFVISPGAWANYYLPLERRLGELMAEHAGDPDLANEAEEIAVWREHGRDYSYGFFVASP